MYEIILLLRDMCGLNETPVTVLEFLQWFVLMMFAVAILCGFIKMIWHTTIHAKEIFGKWH